MTIKTYTSSNGRYMEVVVYDNTFRSNFPKKRCTTCNTKLPPSTQPKKRGGSNELQYFCDKCFRETL